MASDTFFCYVCQNANTPCSKQTFRKENFANCDAVRKSLGFPAFATALECQNYCTTSTNPIDINPVCWLCQGDGTCDHFLAFNGECPKGRNVFERREDCIANCSAIMPVPPPIQPIGPPPIRPVIPPIKPIRPPPIQPIKPVKDDRIFWYVVITAVVLMLLALLIGSLILFV